MAERRDLGPAFTSLLTATFITNIGDGIRLATLPLLATTLTDSPLLVTAVTAAQFFAWPTFGPIGGVIVDRADRRRLIMFTQAWRALVMAALTVAVLTDSVQIWHLCLVAFVITVGEIQVDPSVVATLPTLVEMDDLDRANGRLSTTETISNDFAGGPVGALLFAAAPWAPFLVDAATYLLSVLPFSRLPTRPKPEPAERPALRKEMGEGFGWLAQHPFLRPWTQAVTIFNLGVAGAFSLLVLLVVDVLDASDLAFGFVLAAAAVGATGGALLGPRLTERLSRGTVITGAATVTAVTILVASIVTETWQLIVVWILNGASAGITLAIGRGFIQRYTPNELLGRTAIASRTITRTSFVIGALLAGAVADATSVRLGFATAGAVQLVGVVLFARAFRSAPDEPRIS
jgi:MFS family permease